MSKSADLREIIDARLGHDFVNSSVLKFYPLPSAYLDLELGEVVLVPYSFTRDSKKMNLNESPVKGKQVLNSAEEAIRDGRYIKIPPFTDDDEYCLMIKFCQSIEDNQVSESLYQILTGKLGMQRFKKSINLRGLIEDWDSFARQELRLETKEWCDRNGIDYFEEA